MICKNRYKYWFILILIIGSVFNAEGAELINHLLPVSVAEKMLLEDSNVKIVDIRKHEEYRKGHYEGAVNIWRSDFVDTTYEYGGMMASRDYMTEVLSSLGIEQDDKILLYDGKGGCESARFWWVLKIYGHHKAYVIDGGVDALLLDSTKVSLDVQPITITQYQFPQEQDLSLLASMEDVKKAISDQDVLILDTRTWDEYVGATQKNGAYRKGRIPNSIHNDWVKAVEGSTGRVKSYRDLAYDFEKLGLNKDKKIIVYCQSGVRSAHTTFVLTEILGYKHVKNYDGSWIEWSYHNELPIEIGEYVQPVEVSKSTVPTYWDVFLGSFASYGNYVWSEITFQAKPWYQNYFWWLILLSVVVWLLELAFPWRRNQPKIREDFWIDAFYMFFNFYIFNLVIFIAFCNLTSQVFSDLIGGQLSDYTLINIQDYPEWLQLLVFFVALDFIQWFTHVLLHRYDFLWRFHKVHHSVEEMGFAAHLRYHWMENVFYTPMKYIMVMLIGGFSPEQAFIVYYIAIAIGHINHANIGIDYGPLKYILNNPKMHIWHHAYELPESHKHGANFGISLSVWDYIFKTNYIPHSGRDIRLGFDKIEKYPKTFIKQLFSGFSSKY